MADFAKIPTGNSAVDRIQDRVAAAFKARAADGAATVRVPNAVGSLVLGATDQGVRYVGAGGTDTVTLPRADAQGVAGTGQTITVENAGTGAVAVKASGTDTVAGVSATSVAPGGVGVFVSDGVSRWFAASSPPVPLVSLEPGSFTVPDNFAAFFPDRLQIDDGVTVTIGGLGIVQVGG